MLFSCTTYYFKKNSLKSVNERGLGHSVARDLCACGPSAISNPTTYCFPALVIVFKAMPKGCRASRGRAAATTAGRGAITTRSAATQSTTRGRGRGAAGLSRAATNAASRSSTQAALPNLDPHILAAILAAIRAEIEAAFSAAGDPQGRIQGIGMGGDKVDARGARAKILLINIHYSLKSIDFIA